MTHSPTIKCHRPALTHTTAQAANDNVTAAVPVITPVEATSQTDLVVSETPVSKTQFSNKQSELTFQPGIDQPRLTSTTVVTGLTSTTSVVKLRIVRCHRSRATGQVEEGTNQEKTNVNKPHSIAHN